LHPTDFSELAANAFHAAFALARAHNARLILLYVKQPQETIQGEFGLMPPNPRIRMPEYSTDSASWCRRAQRSQSKRFVLHGNVADIILQVAKTNQCDLIVLGTHGRKGLARLIYGDVADSVTRAAPCPVLALRTSQTEAEEP